MRKAGERFGEMNRTGFELRAMIMNEEELKKIIEKHETGSVEFKESLSLKDETGEEVSAFSNSKGGRILIGIKDNKEVIGLQIGKKTLEDLANYIKTHTDNHVFPKISVEEIEGKKIVVIGVKESGEKPVFFKGRAYMRVGNSAHKLSASEIRKMAKETGDKIYWDSKPCENATLEDIDENKMQWFLREARKQRGLKIPEDVFVVDALKTLNLLKNGKLTNACMLLFSKEPKFLQSEVKCIRFSGNEPVKPYIDFQTIEGNVFDMVDKAEDFILRNIRKAIWLVPGQVQREEKYEYPPDALREAIINAVVHRDYESPSKVQVRIFDTSIEVWNPGILPSDITIEDLKKEHRSIPRNPLLFKQMFWVKYVEDVGGGTLDMVRQCREWGILEPEFKIVTGAFVVIFRIPPSTENLEKLGLNERQIKAVEYVGKKSAITNKEYTGFTGVARKTATRDLTGLVEKGVFRAIGSGKRDIKYVLFLRKNDAKMTQKMTQNADYEE